MVIEYKSIGWEAGSLTNIHSLRKPRSSADGGGGASGGGTQVRHPWATPRASAHKHAKVTAHTHAKVTAHTHAKVTVHTHAKVTAHMHAKVTAHTHAKVTAHHIGFHPCRGVWQYGVDVFTLNSM